MHCEVVELELLLRHFASINWHIHMLFNMTGNGRKNKCYELIGWIKMWVHHQTYSRSSSTLLFNTPPAKAKRSDTNLTTQLPK